MHRKIRRLKENMHEGSENKKAHRENNDARKKNRAVKEENDNVTNYLARHHTINVLFLY